MSLSVTIRSRSAEGESYRVALEKVLDDRGIMRVQGWPPGADGGDPPDSDETVELYDIRTLSPLELACRGKVRGMTPTIACRLAGSEEEGRRIEVEIAGTLFGLFDGVRLYPVAAADFDALRGFIRRADFPPA